MHLADISIRQNAIDQAVLFLEEALKITEQIKVKVKEYQIHEKLSDIYLSKSDLTKSLFHFNSFHNIKEEVQLEDNQKK